MKNILLIALACMLLATGCGAKVLNKTSDPVLSAKGIPYKYGCKQAKGPDGKTLVTKAGRPVLVDCKFLMSTSAYTVEEGFNKMLAEVDRNKQPIARMSFPEGGTMPKGALLEVYGPNGVTKTKQYIPESVQVINAAGNKLMKLAPAAVAITAVRAVGDIASQPRTQTTTVNAQNKGQVNLGDGRQGAVNTEQTANGEGGQTHASGGADQEDNDTSREGDSTTAIIPFN